jgi:UDP-N-acetylmuramoyl-L-alanyl-D-glutamate--2,6-diaminopimelate ligase
VLLSNLISSIATRTPIHPKGPTDCVRICDLTEDSRTVVPGSLFVARGGLKSDGKQFVHDAIAAGAVAILTEDTSLDIPDVPVIACSDVLLASALAAEVFYGRPSSSLSLVGVTGTNGKTTTTHLLWRLLNSVRRRTGLIGTVMIDDGREVAPAAMTTPPAIEISRTLATMIECGCSAAAMEVSSHSLDQRRVDALDFKVGVFTNLTGDHLDYHKSMDLYAQAKSRLFELLPSTGIAVINGHDPYADLMVKHSKARVVRCWLGHEIRPGDHVTVQVTDASIRGLSLTLNGPWGQIGGHVPLIGDYNAMNVLQAVTCAWALGVPTDLLQQSLSALDTPPGRLERVSDDDCDITLFVDYAHSDDALANVLTAIGRVIPGRAGSAVRSTAGSDRTRQSGRLWVVFGCGGDRDRTKRPRMGRVASELADVAIVTSDNPRTERPGQIIDEILDGVPTHQRSKITVQADRGRAIRYAAENAQPGDIIVVAGKGHETVQILSDGHGGTIYTAFDDRQVAREALTARVVRS